MAQPHGVVVTEGALGAPPIELAEVSNIGIIGTAPEATGKFVDNDKAYLITSRAQAPSSGADSLGSEGTLPGALDGIYSQTRARVVFIKVAEYREAAAISSFSIAEANWVDPDTDGPGEVTTANRASLYLDSDGKGILRVQGSTTTTPPRADLLDISAGQVITIAAATTDGVYEVTGKPTEGTTSGSAMYADIPIEQTTEYAGDRQSIAVAAQTAADAESNQRTAAIGVAGDLTGVYAFLSAQGEVGIKPSIICAPDLDTGTRVSSAKNPLGAALETVAGRIRAIALIDGPGTTHTDALEFADDYGNDRTYLIDPKVRILPAGETDIVDRAASPYVAGLIVKSDKDRGWWNSPSNQPLLNVLGTNRPIDFVMGDDASRAEILNQAGIATIINHDGGYRLWGNETPASGDRVPWKFISVRRTADVLYQSVQDNHLWAVDRGITRTYFSDVAEGVNAFIRDLISQGALIAGRCFQNADLNTEANIALGRAYFNVEYTPVYPAQSVIFQVNLTTDALATLAQ